MRASGLAWHWRETWDKLCISSDVADFMPPNKQECFTKIWVYTMFLDLFLAGKSSYRLASAERLGRNSNCQSRNEAVAVGRSQVGKVPSPREKCSECAAVLTDVGVMDRLVHCRPNSPSVNSSNPTILGSTCTDSADLSSAEVFWRAA